MDNGADANTVPALASDEIAGQPPQAHNFATIPRRDSHDDALRLSKNEKFDSIAAGRNLALEGAFTVSQKRSSACSAGP
jgi:hypothetical protein